MTENTTCGGTHPDVEIIDKLADAIMTVCDRRRELEKRRDAMGEELASLLCPFTEGETVRLPVPPEYAGHKEGILRCISLDLEYGYQLWLAFTDETGTETGGDKVSCFQNPDVERFNGKPPILPREQMRGVLRQLRDINGGYY